MILSLRMFVNKHRIQLPCCLHYSWFKLFPTAESATGFTDSRDMYYPIPYPASAIEQPSISHHSMMSEMFVIHLKTVRHLIYCTSKQCCENDRNIGAQASLFASTPGRDWIIFCRSASCPRGAGKCSILACYNAVEDLWILEWYLRMFLWWTLGPKIPDAIFFKYVHLRTLLILRTVQFMSMMK